MIVLGLSSGTSVDGIDVAAGDFTLQDGDVALTPLGHLEVPYTDGLRSAVLDALPPAPTTMESVCRIDAGIGQEFATAARTAVDQLCGGRADLVVSHGQTVFHWVQGGRAEASLQLGQPAWIAEATGLPVVSDVRARDIAAGGHGAPLASILDVLLLGDRTGPTAALNLGGIANITVVRPAADPLAFDTGPGNALIDAAVRAVSGGREHYDADGRRAAAGRVDQGLLERLLAEPYYRLDPPKSTGKELFHPEHLTAAVGDRAVSDDDLVATATELTARTVAAACRSHGVGEVLASGGGTRNPTLMTALRAALAPARLATVEELGLPSEAKEAYLFALLGFLTWHGIPATIASCTGARHATPAGRITPGATSLTLPAPARTRPHRLLVVPPPGRTPASRTS